MCSFSCFFANSNVTAAKIVESWNVNTTVTIRWRCQEGKLYRKCQMMHTKHADRAGLNDLSELVIGCEFAVLNAYED